MNQWTVVDSLVSVQVCQTHSAKVFRLTWSVNETQQSTPALSGKHAVNWNIKIMHISFCDWSSRCGFRWWCQWRQHDPSSWYWCWDHGSGGHAGLNARRKVWKQERFFCHCRLSETLHHLQAVMASDFAISHFKHLKKLLLVHGHWCYSRLANMIIYFFYKNVVRPESATAFHIMDGMFWPKFASSSRPTSTSCSGTSSSVASPEPPWSTTGWWFFSTSSSPLRHPSCLG